MLVYDDRGETRIEHVLVLRGEILVRWPSVSPIGKMALREKIAYAKDVERDSPRRG